MAWQPIDTHLGDHRQRWRKDVVTGRLSPTGGLTIYFSCNVTQRLGWKDGERLALMRGGGESEGKLAVKPDPAGLLSAHVQTFRRGDRGTVRLGRFAGLAELKEIDKLPFEIVGQMLVITPRDHWLKKRGPVAIGARTIGISRAV